MHELRLALSVSMKTLAEICSLFETDEPYFGALVEERFSSLGQAESVELMRRKMGDEGTEIFLSLISGFGRGYLDSEIKRVDIIINNFDRYFSDEKSQILKRLRVYKTLGFSASFALTILFI